ncbi:MAG TPA: hypothetical protein VMN57_03340 [Anaerolineales bacterium]|nr:hypothetical protein [Anaerolineales bacterium]
MISIKLNAMVTKALTDSRFCADILNGHRRERIQEYHLADNVVQAVMGIKAKNLDQFIRGLETWMTATNIQ